LQAWCDQGLAESQTLFHQASAECQSRQLWNPVASEAEKKFHFESESSLDRCVPKPDEDQDTCATSQTASCEVNPELAQRIRNFIDGNELDSEASKDLWACQAEVQEMVLSKGDVAFARNPSAKLRVHINQAERALRKAKVSQLALAVMPASDVSEVPACGKIVSPKSCQNVDTQKDKELSEWEQGRNADTVAKLKTSQ